MNLTHILLEGAALLGFNTPPLGALPEGTGGVFPTYAKILRRNLRSLTFV
jgi:hypothetical protein